MLIKAGVDISRLKPCIRKKLGKIETIIYDIAGEEFVITSTYEGNHSASSLHYCDEAIDIRRPSKPESIIRKIKRFLGLDYDVILYNSHIHIEYDPKKTMADKI
jgi:hypothetical protein